MNPVPHAQVSQDGFTTAQESLLSQALASFDEVADHLDKNTSLRIARGPQLLETLPQSSGVNHEVQARLKAILESMTIEVSIPDSQEQNASVNRAAEAMLEKAREDQLSRARGRKGHSLSRAPAIHLCEDHREAEMDLHVAGQRMGLVRFRRSPDRPAFDSYEIEVLGALANLFALALWGSDVHRQAESLVATDELTNLLNPQAFSHALERELKKAARYGQPVVLLMIHIDHLEEINNRFGSPAGENILRQLAGLVVQTVREADVTARYGGEEFAVIMPGTSQAEALVAAERIRRLIVSHIFLPECRDYRVTVSIGLSHHTGGNGTDGADLVRNADLALNQAKTHGRNRIEVAGHIPLPQRPAGQSLQPTVQ